MLIKVEKQKVVDFFRNLNVNAEEYMRGKDIIVPFRSIEVDLNNGEDVFTFWNFNFDNSHKWFENVKYYFEVHTISAGMFFLYTVNICEDYSVFTSAVDDEGIGRFADFASRNGLALINTVKSMHDKRISKTTRSLLRSMIRYSVQCLMYVLCIFSEKQSQEKIYKYIGEPSVKRGIKKRGYSQIVLHDNIQAKISKEDVELIERIREKKYERHAEAWEVRGHLRRYKSGKVVYIKPYTKGRGRVNRKEYAIK